MSSNKTGCLVPQFLCSAHSLLRQLRLSPKRRAAHFYRLPSEPLRGRWIRGDGCYQHPRSADFETN
jgi:hypothetical protein